MRPDAKGASCDSPIGLPSVAACVARGSTRERHMCERHVRGGHSTSLAFQVDPFPLDPSPSGSFPTGSTASKAAVLLDDEYPRG